MVLAKSYQAKRNPWHQCRHEVTLLPQQPVSTLVALNGWSLMLRRSELWSYLMKGYFKNHQSPKAKRTLKESKGSNTQDLSESAAAIPKERTTQEAGDLGDQENEATALHALPWSSNHWDDFMFPWVHSEVQFSLYPKWVNVNLILDSPQKENRIFWRMTTGIESGACEPLSHAWFQWRERKRSEALIGWLGDQLGVLPSGLNLGTWEAWFNLHLRSSLPMCSDPRTKQIGFKFGKLNVNKTKKNGFHHNAKTPAQFQKAPQFERIFWQRKIPIGE